MRTGSHSDLLDLIGAIYDAALDETLWLQAIRRIGEAVGTETYSLTLFTGLGVSTPEVNRFMAASEDPAYLKSYADYYLGINPYPRRVPIVDGTVYISQAVIPTEEVWRTEFYNDWQRPQGLDYCAGAIVAVDDYKIVLNFNRRKKRGGFDAESMRALEPLLPHLRRAVAMGLRLGALSADWSMARALLDRMRMGVILLAGDGRPVFVNASAEDVLRGNRGLGIAGDRLIARFQPDNLALQQAIHEAIQTATGEGLRAPVDVRVRSADGTATPVAVVPLRGRHLGFVPAGRTVCAAVLIVVPGISRPLPEESVQVLLGLSRAEARLVAKLVEDQTVAQVADDLGISEHTARNQLKSAMQKMGVRRQAELVRRVLSLPIAWLRKP